VNISKDMRAAYAETGAELTLNKNMQEKNIY
jgi:hypothetical protein